MEKLLDIKEVALSLGVSGNTVRTLVKDGELAEPMKVGRQKKWAEGDVREYLIYAKIVARSKRCQAKS